MQTVLSPFLMGKNKDGTSDTWAAGCSAGSEDMLWLCHRTPWNAIADQHTLAAEIVSTCPCLIPRWPVSSLDIVWSRQSFISSVFGSLGLGQTWDWGSPIWVTKNRPPPQRQAFSRTKIALLCANNRHLTIFLLGWMTCLHKSWISFHGAAGIKCIYLEF